MIKIKFPQLGFACLAITLAFTACTKDQIAMAPKVVKEWTIPLSTTYQNPAIAGRSETGTVMLKLLSDNSLAYTLSVTGLAYGDELVAAHIHTGNVAANGPVILPIDPVFTGSTATGVILNLRSSFADSLKSDLNELYFNIHSKQSPGGLVRGQLNVGIKFAADVVLSCNNQVPMTSTMTTGLSLLRLTTDKKLYSKLIVNNLAYGDNLLYAHIHKGAAGANGPVIINLAETAADFGVIKMFVLTDVNITSLTTEQVYVNVHSTNFPGGIIRGQIR